MIVHVVLFRPKSSVSPADRQAMFDALTTAATGITSVRRFHIGERITFGRGYEQMMREDYPYAAIVEFDDCEGLKAYLDHPLHERLGELFYRLMDASLVYDYSLRAAAIR